MFSRRNSSRRYLFVFGCESSKGSVCALAAGRESARPDSRSDLDLPSYHRNVRLQSFRVGNRYFGVCSLPGVHVVSISQKLKRSYFFIVDGL